MSVRRGLLFLSREWVSRAVAEIERAKKHDEEVRRRTSEFTLRVAYFVDGIPDELRRLYGSDNLVIVIGLDEGRLKEFRVEGVGEDYDVGEVDYRIMSSYDTLKRIFSGEINVVQAYMNRLVKIDPFYKLYVNPRFTAKSLTTVSMLLDIIRRRIETIYL